MTELFNSSTYAKEKTAHTYIYNKKQVKKRTSRVLHTSKNLETNKILINRRVEKLIFIDPHDIT